MLLTSVWLVLLLSCGIDFCALFSSDPLDQRIHDQLYLLNVSGSRVLFAWIPGHCGIPGNDSADQAVHNAPTHSLRTSLRAKFSPERDFDAVE